MDRQLAEYVEIAHVEDEGSSDEGNADWFDAEEDCAPSKDSGPGVFSFIYKVLGLQNPGAKCQMLCPLLAEEEEVDDDDSEDEEDLLSAQLRG